MDDFALKFLQATFYVIIGGAALTWGLIKILDALDALMNVTLIGFIQGTIFTFIVALIALNL